MLTLLERRGPGNCIGDKVESINRATWVWNVACCFQGGAAGASESVIIGGGNIDRPRFSSPHDGFGLQPAFTARKARV
jgi:hypothetical protein